MFWKWLQITIFGFYNWKIKGIKQAFEDFWWRQEFWLWLLIEPCWYDKLMPKDCYPKLTRAYTVGTWLFECPAVLLFAPCTFSNTSFRRLAGYSNGRSLILRPPAGLISAFSRKRNEAYWTHTHWRWLRKYRNQTAGGRVSPCQFNVNYLNKIFLLV